MSQLRMNWSLGAVLLLVSSLSHATTLSLPFTPDMPTGVGFSPEGCWLDAGIAGGNLGPSSGETGDGYAAGHECHSGTLGQQVVNTIGYSYFTSAPFPDGLELAGTVELGEPYAATLYGEPHPSRRVPLEEVRADGITHWITGCSADAADGANLSTFDVPPTHIAPGSRLQLSINDSDIPARILYGGVPVASSVSGVPALVTNVTDYSDTGLTLTLADYPSGKSSSTAGAVTPALCLPFLLGAALRRRSRR